MHHVCGTGTIKHEADPTLCLALDAGPEGHAHAEDGAAVTLRTCVEGVSNQQWSLPILSTRFTNSYDATFGGSVYDATNGVDVTETSQVVWVNSRSTTSAGPVQQCGNILAKEVWNSQTVTDSNGQ